MEAAAFPRPTPTNTVSRMSRAGSLLRCRELPSNCTVLAGKMLLQGHNYAPSNLTLATDAAHGPTGARGCGFSS
jgi:hypothetical protein